MNIRKVHAFISSSMQGEQWLSLREDIKKTLDRTNIIDTFIIEDISASLSSVSTYRVEIQTCDVIVFIFEDKLRPAVKDEFDTAYRNKKKMLMFFKECKREPELEEFKNMVIKMNCCTYKEFKNFDDLKSQVHNSLVNDILRIYRAYCYGSVSIIDEILSGVNVQNEIREVDFDKSDLEMKIVDKTYLNMFNSCKDYLWMVLGLPTPDRSKREPTSSLEILGFALLDWVAGKRDFPWESLKSVKDKIIDLQGKSWVESRIIAFHSYFIEFNIEKTIALLYSAKRRAVESNAPQWVINDILIDIRNMEYAKMNHQGVWFESKAQSELNKSNSDVFYPYIDRLHSNFWDKTFNEFLDRRIDSIYTQHLGGNLKYVLLDLEKLIFVSIAYGSITHVLMIREYLAKILFMYGEIYQSNELTYKALKMFILSGDSKTTRRIFENCWSKLYLEVQKNLNDIWELTSFINTNNQREIMQALLFEKLGYYFDDINFKKHLELIFSFAEKEHFLESLIVSSLKAIQNNISRTDSDKVVKLVILYLERGWIRVIDNMFQLLCRVNWEDVCDEHSKLIVSMITPLLFDNPVGYASENRLIITMRKNLESETNHWDRLVEEKWSHFDKQIYRFETKTVDQKEAIDALQQNIKILIDRNKEMGRNGSYPVWATDPLKVITAIIENYKSLNVFKFVEKQLFNIIFEILLNQNQTYGEKTSCMKVLIRAKALFVQENYAFQWDYISKKITEQFSNILKGFEFGFGDIDNKLTLEINLLTFLSMCREGSIEDTILRFIELSNEGTIEEIELVKCLVEFVKYNKNIDDIALANILTILLQKSLHEVFEVRWYVAEALWNLSNTRFKGYINAKIYALSEDANYILRHKIIGLAQKMYEVDPISAGLILKKGINDSNYVVRERAKKAIAELGI